MDLSIIIVSFNTRKLIKECIESLTRNTKGIKYEIIVIDNNSKDESAELVRKMSKKNANVKLIENKRNFGFAKANNQGIKKALGRYYLLLNSDTKVSDNILGEMISWMDRNPRVGISSCSLLNKDKSVQGTGGYFPYMVRVISWMTIQDLPFVDWFIKPFHPMHTKSFLVKGNRFYKTRKQLDWVTGAFMVIRCEVVDDIGYLDEKYFMYVEEVDFCYRAKKAGWQVWYLPKWSIVHYGGASGTSELAVISEYKGIKRFYKKHFPKWQYPILRVFLKIGALGRMLLFSLTEGVSSAKIYAKAFKIA
jgi:GT2 family glycosyltransferase